MKTEIIIKTQKDTYKITETENSVIVEKKYHQWEIPPLAQRGYSFEEWKFFYEEKEQPLLEIISELLEEADK